MHPDKPARPAAAPADTDAESGLTGEDDRAASLRALDAMFRRGLIAEADYRRRRTALLGRPDDA